MPSQFVTTRVSPTRSCPSTLLGASHRCTSLGDSGSLTSNTDTPACLEMRWPGTYVSSSVFTTSEKFVHNEQAKNMATCRRHANVGMHTQNRSCTCWWQPQTNLSHKCSNSQNSGRIDVSTTRVTCHAIATVRYLPQSRFATFLAPAGHNHSVWSFVIDVAIDDIVQCRRVGYRFHFGHCSHTGTGCSTVFRAGRSGHEGVHD